MIHFNIKESNLVDVKSSQFRNTYSEKMNLYLSSEHITPSAFKSSESFMNISVKISPSLYEIRLLPELGIRIKSLKQNFRKFSKESVRYTSSRLDGVYKYKNELRI